MDNFFKNHGPLFIVGMPRSGTKLLRNLLNRHPRIYIDTMETVFLPFWYQHWQSYGDLSDYQRFEAFYLKNLKLRYMRNYLELNRLVTASDWYQNCRTYDTAGVFEGLIRSQTENDRDSDVIWGDKTPSYLVQIPLIKKIYPDARIIHIIRDVRDYCLSLHHTWNKNMLRAAQRWVDDVGKARSDGKGIKGYLEVTYEKLLENPKREIQIISEFIGVDFNSAMLTLLRPSEKSGDAKGKTSIVRNNTRKYETRMDPRVRHIIEMVAAERLCELGYPTLYHGPTRRIGKVRMQLYRLIDGINLILRGKIQNFSDIVTAATFRH